MGNYDERQKLFLDGSLDEIFDKVASEHNVDKQIIKKYFLWVFKKTSELIKCPTMPFVQLTHLGTLRPGIGKMRWVIYRNIYHYRNNSISKGILKERIQWIRTIMKRRINEKINKGSQKNWATKEQIEEKINNIDEELYNTYYGR